MISSLKDLIKDCIPHISLDCVVFGYQEKKLNVLLLKYINSDAWALPGGFLPKNKAMDEVVGDILKDRTGIDNIFLNQFHTFSSTNRIWDSNELNQATLASIKESWSKEDIPILVKWFQQRFISTAYLALVDAKQVNPFPDDISEVCTWIPLDELPTLILDHEEIINKALEHLRIKLNYLPIGRELLDEKFTMVELQSLYEAIMGEKLDRGNFQRKILKLKMLIRHEKLMTGAQNKAPYLYSIDHQVYNQLLEDGIGFK